MKIGTVSFEVRGDYLSMAQPSRVRSEALRGILKNFGPDLLVCAGFTLDRTDELDELQDYVTRNNVSTDIIIEARNASEKSRLCSRSPLKH